MVKSPNNDDDDVPIVFLYTFFSSGSENACEKTSFTFLRQELPVRLANILKEIDLLPDNLLRTPSVHLVQSWSVGMHACSAKIGICLSI